MKYYAMTKQEVANALNIPRGTVDSIERRALEKLRMMQDKKARDVLNKIDMLECMKGAEHQDSGIFTG